MDTSEPIATSLVDLRELKLAHAMHLLTDPTRPICQYEIPGGGECRDRECQDVHPSRMQGSEPSGTHLRSSFNFTYVYIAPPHNSLPHSHYSGSLPTDEETAKFLYARLAQHNCSFTDLKRALEDVRQRSPTKSIDERVSAALVAVGVQ